MKTNRNRDISRFILQFFMLTAVLLGSCNTNNKQNEKPVSEKIAGVQPKTAIIPLPDMDFDVE